MNKDTEEDAKIWLLMSGEDLKVADLIFNGKVYSQALYHLQQSNEKLVKALLLWIGILTPKRTKEDWKIKSTLGFLPKQPAEYGHKTFRPLLSDLQKFTPKIKELTNLLESGGFYEKIAEFEKTIKKSKKGIYKLKKRSYRLIEENEQLEKEVKATRAILDSYDNIIDGIDQEICKLDFQQIVRKSLSILAKGGITANAEPPTFMETKETILWSLKVSLLIVLSISMAIVLDPLEAITRYPDSKHAPFDENNPYVIQYGELREVIMLCHRKALETIY